MDDFRSGSGDTRGKSEESWKPQESACLHRHLPGAGVKCVCTTTGLFTLVLGMDSDPHALDWLSLSLQLHSSITSVVQASIQLAMILLHQSLRYWGYRQALSPSALVHAFRGSSLLL